MRVVVRFSQGKRRVGGVVDNKNSKIISFLGVNNFFGYYGPEEDLGIQHHERGRKLKKLSEFREERSNKKRYGHNRQTFRY